MSGALPPRERVASFAVLVASNLKGKGLGKRLMQHLIAYAQAEGFSELSGTVLAENQTMLDFCARLGFRIVEDPEDLGIRIASLTLGTGKDFRSSVFTTETEPVKSFLRWLP